MSIVRAHRHPTSTAALAVLALLLAGCDAADPGTPAAPTGGRRYVLDAATYTTDVGPRLSARGCDSIACHGGGLRGTFELSPADDKDPDFDFLQVARQVDPATPALSNILQKPLAPAAGGAVHAADPAVSGFLSTADPDYQLILAWIEAGEYQ